MNENEQNYDSNKKTHKTEVAISRIVICLAILAVGVLGFFGLAALKPKPKERPSEELIKSLIVEEIKPETILAEVSGFSTIRPLKEVELSAQVTGTITATREKLKAGTLVKKGEMLAKIDDSDYVINLKEAVAELARLRGEKKVLEQTLTDNRMEVKSVNNIYELELKEYQRTLSLFQKRVKTQAGLNRANQDLSARRKELIALKTRIINGEVQIQTVEAQIDRALAQEGKAKLDIKRCTIKSPFDARLKNVYIEGGEHVSIGEKLFELADDYNLEAPTPIDAFDAASSLDLKPNLKDYGHWFTSPADVKVVIQWTDNPSKCKWEGQIARVESYNSETRAITVVAKPTKPLTNGINSFPLISGMFCKVTFYGKKMENAVRIPWIAIQFDRDVFVVDETGILKERKIKIFSTDGDRVIVSSGLKKGDLLVVQRLPRGMTNGMQVKPIRADGKEIKLAKPTKKRKKKAQAESPTSKKNRT